MQTPWHITREEVKRASDIESTAYNDMQVDLACAAGTDAVNTLCHRVFWPWKGTRYKNWPNAQFGDPVTVWLDADELIELTALSSGGVTISSDQYLLEPWNSGPPYNRIEINRSSSAAWGGGTTEQRAVVMTGLFGHSNTEISAGALAAAVSTTTATSIDVTDSATIGVGSLIRIGTERMIVTGKALLTTGQTLQSPLDSDVADNLMAVSNGAAFTPQEVLTIDAERVLVEDVAGNNLVVRRAIDGTGVAAHTGSTIYAPRTLRVARGALGTTAATHTSGTAVALHRAPAPVRQLALAEAQSALAQISANWVRVIGSGENAREAFARGLRDERDKVYAAYGRKARMRVIK